MKTINAITRRWALVLACVLFGIVAAALLSLTQSRDYSATVRMYVAAGTSDLAEAYQGGIAAQNAVHSFAVLASDPSVASRAIKSSGVPISVDELVAATSASTPPQTVILDLSVKYQTADGAGKLANAMAQDLIVVVDKLEGPAAGGPGALRLVVVDPNTQGAVRDELLSPLFLAAGAVLGGLVGIVAAAALEGRAARRETDGPPAEAGPSDSAYASVASAGAENSDPEPVDDEPINR
ncbi:YveK family protein [Gordonia iterans]